MSNDDNDRFDLPPDYVPSGPARKRAVEANDITVAMMSAEDGVDMPVERTASSVVRNLIGLDVGECFTRSVLVDDAVTMKQLKENLNDWKYRLRQSVNQAVRRAREVAPRTLTMETSQCISPTGQVYVQVIVTRTA